MIRPTGLVRLDGLFLEGLLGLIAAGSLFGGVVAAVSGQLVGLPILAFGAVMTILVVLIHFGLVRGPRRGMLTVTVFPDHIDLRRGRSVPDRVERGEVGFVAIHTFSRAGVGWLDVFGPDRALVGRWDTATRRGPTTYTRAFGRLDYPWVLRREDRTPARTIRRSPSAPAWADSVLAP